jgi:tetratricopeptide (TPR) repeat protein
MRTLAVVRWWRRRRAEMLDRQRFREAALNITDILRSTIIFPLEGFTQRAKEAIAHTEATGKYRIGFIGNWWVEGNPYKGLNIELIPTDKPWKYAIAKSLWIRGLPKLGLPLPVKAELQLHTQESLETAQANHHLYKIMRNTSEPIARRQQAFDEMSASFARVKVPQNIEQIGFSVTVSRPTPNSENTLQNTLNAIKERVGGDNVIIETTKPEYSAGLQELLDRARGIAGTNPNVALLYFEEAARKYDNYNDVWSKRGVAAALLNSGELLIRLKKYTEAVSMFERLIERAGSDEELELEVMNAASLLARAKELHERGGKRQS